MFKKLMMTAACLAALTGGASAGDLIGRFSRTYDKAHLAAHPDQLVTQVDLSLEKSSTQHYSHHFTLRVMLRGRDKVLKTGGSCQDEETVWQEHVQSCKQSGEFDRCIKSLPRFVGGLSCRVECDGGGVHVKLRGDHAMMYLDRIRMVTCDQDIKKVIDGGEEISGGKDDRVFRLYRMTGAEHHFDQIPTSYLGLWCGEASPMTRARGIECPPKRRGLNTLSGSVEMFSILITPRGYETPGVRCNVKPKDLFVDREHPEKGIRPMFFCAMKKDIPPGGDPWDASNWIVTLTMSVAGGKLVIKEFDRNR
jgi:hypothetical protein